LCKADLKAAAGQPATVTEVVLSSLRPLSLKLEPSVEKKKKGKRENVMTALESSFYIVRAVVDKLISFAFQGLQYIK
jgi:hypothetical protein